MKDTNMEKEKNEQNQSNVKDAEQLKKSLKRNLFRYSKYSGNEFYLGLLVAADLLNLKAAVEHGETYAAVNEILVKIQESNAKSHPPSQRTVNSWHQPLLAYLRAKLPDKEVSIASMRNDKDILPLLNKQNLKMIADEYESWQAFRRKFVQPVKKPKTESETGAIAPDPEGAPASVAKLTNAGSVETIKESPPPNSFDRQACAELAALTKYRDLVSEAYRPIFAKIDEIKTEFERLLKVDQGVDNRQSEPVEPKSIPAPNLDKTP
jgi:hypothetical protein